VTIVGLATGAAPLILLGGAAFIAGAVATAVKGRSAAELAQDVADTQSEIEKVTASIDDRKYTATHTSVAVYGASGLQIHAVYVTLMLMCCSFQSLV